MGLIKNLIIKSLGGYTKKEYNRLTNKYQALLDSKTDNTCSFMCNEYMMRLLQSLHLYTRTLYGQPDWAEKMYNVIHNNYLRIMIRYVHQHSSIIYTLDTTIDNKNEFIQVLRDDKNEEEINFIETENV